jgi:hypothetical protein
MTPRRMLPSGAPALLACALLLFAGAATAAAEDNPGAEERALFARGVSALERGAYGEAIDVFELMADRGVVHPDLSFDLGVAYLGRARSSEARPGDLGRVAAALSETLELRPDDEEAELALSKVRSEVSRRLARQGVTDTLSARPSLGRAVAGLVPENIWAALAALGSGLLGVGLLTRELTQRAAPRLVANTLLGIGGFLLIVTGGLSFAARWFRTRFEPAIVVVEQARLLDEQGMSKVRAGSVSEGSLVYVRETHGDLARVEWSGNESWLRRSEIRVLSRR